MNVDLGSVPLFADCSKKELKSIRSRCMPIRLPAGREVLGEGDRGQECVIVVEGALDIEQNGNVIATAGPGEIVGEIAVIEGAASRRTATVTTASESVLLVFGASDFRRLMSEHPEIASQVSATAVHRLAADRDRSSD